MKKSVSFLLMGYGALVLGLGLLTQRFAPTLAKPSLLAGVVGGSFSLLVGLLCLAGKPCRSWAMFTLAATGFVILSQMVTHWMPSGTRALAVITTVMFIFTFGTLLAVAHLGGPEQTTNGGESRKGEDGHRSERKPGAASSDAWKEARRRSKPDSEEPW
jgi:hypothetical protein